MKEKLEQILKYIPAITCKTLASILSPILGTQNEVLLLCQLIKFIEGKSSSLVSDCHFIYLVVNIGVVPASVSCTAK